MSCFFSCVRFDDSVTTTEEKPTITGSVSVYGVTCYSWDDVESLTSNFSRLIGSGGYSSIYLARLSASNKAALKVHVGSHRLYQVFKSELDILLRLQHPHIVKLLGYFDDSESGALLLEYLPQGNLQEKLNRNSKQVLPWRNRTAIAFQVAQAIEHIHENCSPQIVHGDIKSSNILLDKHFNSKLCDFGSAKVGFSSMVQPSTTTTTTMSPRSKQVMMIGSPGYTDPHYLRTGIASKKMDMYGFGVVVLELVSGKEAVSSERGEMLVHTAPPLIDEILDSNKDVAEEKVRQFLDPRLSRDSSVDLEEVKTMLRVASLCLRSTPSLRPSASQVVKTLVQKIPSLSLSFLSCGNTKVSDCVFIE